MTSLGFSLSDRDLMMRFTGLGVGHLEHKARNVHRLTVEDEPNWSELCSTTAATSEPSPANIEPDDDTDSDDDSESDEGLDDNAF